MIRISELARPELKANPYPFYARLRSEWPVCPTKLIGLPTWLVTRYDDVLMALKDERYAKDLPSKTKWIHRLSGPMTRHMLNKDAPDHTRLRTLVHKAFTPSLVERLRGRIQRCSDELLNKLKTTGSMDLIGGYALPLPLTIIAELLGIPVEHRNRLHALSRSTLNATNTVGVLRSFPDQRLIVRRLRKVIAERRHEPREDLISALVQAEEAGDKLSEPELVGTIVLLLVAGYETTVNLIGNAALALIQNGEQRQLFLEGKTSASTAIEELLRYTSPLDVASLRFAREDIQVDSVTIPKGHLVLAVLGSANHDQAQFRNPETLDLTRDPNRHVAFGQGVHFCLGAPLARLEGEIALSTLFQRFPNLRLACPSESLRWRKSLVVRGLEKLPVVASEI